MPEKVNDIVAVSSGGMMRSDNPSAPTLSLAISGSNIVATIDGDAGVTNYLKYKSSTQSSWQDGGSRSGDGTITVSDLASGVVYVFIAYSQHPDTLLYSLPSAAKTASFSVAASVENEFDGWLADSAGDFFTEFGEAVTYLPSGGGSREIIAVVDREPPEELTGGGHAPKVIISVANDSDDGISSSEINKSKDKVELSVRIGETAQQRLITSIISQDAGMMMLGVN
jgi:hypothetical protein